MLSDFFFQVFERKLSTVDELKEAIPQAFADFDANHNSVLLCVTVPCTGSRNVVTFMGDISMT